MPKAGSALGAANDAKGAESAEVWALATRKQQSTASWHSTTNRKGNTIHQQVSSWAVANEGDRISRWRGKLRIKCHRPGQQADHGQCGQRQIRMQGSTSMEANADEADGGSRPTRPHALIVSTARPAGVLLMARCCVQHH